MEQFVIDDVKVSVEYSSDRDARVEEGEVRAYLARAHEKYPHGKLESLVLKVDGEEVEVGYVLAPVPFDRIRRITGYLVGTLDRFNDAKRAEEADRVKHGL